MVFLVYRIETFSFSEGFPGRFLSSALKSNHNSLIKGLYTVSVRLILPISTSCHPNDAQILLLYRAHLPYFSDYPARQQRVATDSLGKTPLLDMHLLIIKVVAIPCNKENSQIRW